MANRQFTSQFNYSFMGMPVTLSAFVLFGAAGAPTLLATRKKGFESITRNSAGNYTFVLADKYQGFLTACLAQVASPPAAPFVFAVSNTVNTTRTVVIQYYAVDGVTPTDPASGEQLRLQFMLNSSTIQG